jgi:hypothetical protein
MTSRFWLVFVALAVSVPFAATAWSADELALEARLWSTPSDHPLFHVNVLAFPHTEPATAMPSAVTETAAVSGFGDAPLAELTVLATTGVVWLTFRYVAAP